MAQPTDTPDWATTPDTDGISGQPSTREPPDAKKALGFGYREKLARNWLNWWMNVVYQWVAWFKTKVADERKLRVGWASGVLYDAAQWAYEASARRYIKQTGATDAEISLSLPLREGQRLKSWTAYVHQPGAASSASAFVRITNASDGTSDDEPLQSAPATANYCSFGQTGLTREVAADEMLDLNLVTTAANTRFYAVEIVYDEGA